MKYIFLTVFICLLIASFFTYLSFPEQQSKVPVLYWVTGNSGVRQNQVKTFEKWLVQKGYTTGDGQPEMILKVDAANRSVSKIIIQGVSGIGGDLIDTNYYTSYYFQSIGLMTDITDQARAGGYSPAATYKALKPEIVINGRQYMFPASLEILIYWVNKDLFQKYGIEPPPGRWSIEKFEEIGKKFVAAANREPQEQRVYFATRLPMFILMLMRSMGLSCYNETLTRCTLDDERFIKALKLINKWTHEDHLFPSADEIASFNVASGFGGMGPQMFYKGTAAMLMGGRYSLMNLRRLGKMNLAVSEMPNAGIPNTFLVTRAPAIYIGSKYKKEAELFLKFLASEEYNLQLVKDSDAIPPNPRYARTEEFLRPADYPNEWGCHKAIIDAVENDSVGPTHSPFALSSVLWQHIRNAESSVLSGVVSPEAAARQAARRVNLEIARSVRENKEMRTLYDKLCADQKRIDELRAAGKPVPVSLIKNIFYKFMENKNDQTK